MDVEINCDTIVVNVMSQANHAPKKQIIGNVALIGPAGDAAKLNVPRPDRKKVDKKQVLKKSKAKPKPIVHLDPAQRPKWKVIRGALKRSNVIIGRMVDTNISGETLPCFYDSVGAGRAFRQGEVILDNEPPLLVIPIIQNPNVNGVFYSDDNVICVSCYKLVPSNSRSQPLQTCTQCNFTVCSSACSLAPAHRWECQLIGDYPEKVGLQIINSSAPKMALCFAILRIFQVKSQDPLKWDLILQTALKTTKSPGLEDFLERNKDVILPVSDLIGPELCGTLEGTCAAEITKTLRDLYSLLMRRSVFFNPEMMGFANGSIFEASGHINHSCLPNTVAGINPTTGCLTLVAAVPIKKREELTLPRMCTDELSLQFQALQLALHDFSTLPSGVCNCSACVSQPPYMKLVNTFRCPSTDCPGSILIPDSFLNSNPEKGEEVFPPYYWKCSETACNRLVKKTKMVKAYDILEKKYTSLYNRMEMRDWSCLADLEGFIRTLSSIVVGDHYLILKGMSLYSLFPDMVVRMSTGSLARAYSYQRYLSDAFEKFNPGLSIYKAIAAFQRHRIMELVLLRTVARGEVTEVSKLPQSTLLWNQMEAELKEVDKHIGWRKEMQQIDVLVPIFDALNRHHSSNSPRGIEFHICLSPRDIMANVEGVTYDPVIHRPPGFNIPALKDASGCSAFKVAQDSQFHEFRNREVTKKFKRFVKIMKLGVSEK